MVYPVSNYCLFFQARAHFPFSFLVSFNVWLNNISYHAMGFILSCCFTLQFHPKVSSFPFFFLLHPLFLCATPPLLSFVVCPPAVIWLMPLPVRCVLHYSDFTMSQVGFALGRLWRTRNVSVVVGGMVPYWANKITKITSQNCLLSVLLWQWMGRKGLLGDHSRKLVETNIRIDWWDQSTDTLWLERACRPPAHTKHHVEGFADARGDAENLGLLQIPVPLTLAASVEVCYVEKDMCAV